MAYTQPVITSDVGTFSPLLRTTASLTIPTRNQVHDLLGGGVAVTFGGDALSSTSLEMVFTSEADALEAYTQLNTGHVFQITDYSKTSTSMYFSVSGNLTREYLVETEDTWLVTCDIQEVVP